MINFNHIFISVLNHLSQKLKKQKAIRYSILYITILQLSLIIFLSIVSIKFFLQFNITLFNTSNLWGILILTTIIVYFRNWMFYTGKKINSIKSKLKPSNSGINIYALYAIPFILIISSFLLKNVYN